MFARSECFFCVVDPEASFSLPTTVEEHGHENICLWTVSPDLFHQGWLSSKGSI